MRAPAPQPPGAACCQSHSAVLCFLSETVGSTGECARDAYDATLGPYHGWLIASLARTALAFAPHDRLGMIQRFGWRSEAEAVAELSACLDEMDPVLAAVGDFLRAAELDFPDVKSTELHV